LNLLRLLAENRIAGFHTQLEILGEGVRESEPVLFARGLEEWVMEGAYNRVWKAGEGKGVSVYQKFFLDVLMDTSRYDFFDFVDSCRRSRLFSFSIFGVCVFLVFRVSSLCIFFYFLMFSTLFLCSICIPYPIPYPFLLYTTLLSFRIALLLILLSFLFQIRILPCSFISMPLYCVS